jgi:hypothetical protein
MSTPNQLSARLSSQLDALRTVEPGHKQIVQAQNTLDALVQQRTRPHRSRAIGTWLTAAAAGVAAVAIVLLLPTVSQNVAFAEVQRHFADFETLSFIMDTRVGGQTIQQSRVYVNEAGDVRTDVGRDVSVIVNASRKEVLTLAHGPRVAMLMPVTEAPKSEDPLAWLAELRAYQNAAKPLGMKVVDGKTAHGWELEIQGMQTQLWADENGLPLSMKIEQQAMELQMQFTFDAPLAADLFSLEIPQGYRAASED